MKWFKAMAAPGQEGVANITIDGQIGSTWWDSSGIASRDFMAAVKALGDLTEIQIDMNSPGGSVSDGLTIANYLRQHTARVVVNVLGQASSIASVITSAADEVRMGLGSFAFVHHPESVVGGNAAEMRAMALDLETIADGMMDVYVARIGEDRRATMEEYLEGSDGKGTLLSAEMAVEVGLADSMMETRAVASVSVMMKAMSAAAAQANALIKKGEDQPLTPAQALAYAFDIDVSEVESRAQELGDRIVAMRQAGDGTSDGDLSGLTPDAVRAACPDLYAAILRTADHTDASAEAVNEERERVVAILNACKTVDQYGDLEKLVTEDWDAQKASDYILSTAANSERHIDSSHSPDGGQSPGIDTTAIYARRNGRTTK